MKDVSILVLLDDFTGSYFSELYNIFSILNKLSKSGIL